jgi:hypothetical protein
MNIQSYILNKMKVIAIIFLYTFMLTGFLISCSGKGSPVPPKGSDYEKLDIAVPDAELVDNFGHLISGKWELYKSYIHVLNSENGLERGKSYTDLFNSSKVYWFYPDGTYKHIDSTCRIYRNDKCKLWHMATVKGIWQLRHSDEIRLSNIDAHSYSIKRNSANLTSISNNTSFNYHLSGNKISLIDVNSDKLKFTAESNEFEDQGPLLNSKNDKRYITYHLVNKSY